MSVENQAGCEAYQVSDQKRCERCDLLWDMNDPEPPECVTGKDLFERVKHRLHEVNKSVLTCYQCDKETTWLAPDSRCGNCTRYTPEEIK